MPRKKLEFSFAASLVARNEGRRGCGNEIPNISLELQFHAFGLRPIARPLFALLNRNLRCTKRRSSSLKPTQLVVM
jgi:hypothetical protein